MSTNLQLIDIAAAYQQERVLSQLSLEVAAGELLALLGASGCGKTTLLKIIAGLQRPLCGSVLFNGQIIDGLPPERRDIGVVFQKPLLFPHLTVFENIAFGLKMRALAKPEIDRRVAEVLKLVQLDGLAGRRPAELSGGQEQRVALARALVIAPRLLLLDEPFSALDERLRAEMRLLLRTIQRQLKITTIFVTHDQQEAALLSDRIALMCQGSIAQLGPARLFFTSPNSSVSARFFGWQVCTIKAVSDGLLHTDWGDLQLSPTRLDRLMEISGIPDMPVRSVRYLAFRGEQVRVMTDNNCADVRKSSLADRLTLTGKLAGLIDLGGSLKVLVQLATGEILEITEDSLRDSQMLTGFTPGDQVIIEIPEKALRILSE